MHSKFNNLFSYIFLITFNFQPKGCIVNWHSNNEIALLWSRKKKTYQKFITPTKLQWRVQMECTLKIQCVKEKQLSNIRMIARVCRTFTKEFQRSNYIVSNMPLRSTFTHNEPLMISLIFILNEENPIPLPPFKPTQYLPSDTFIQGFYIKNKKSLRMVVFFKVSNIILPLYLYRRFQTLP